MLASNELLPVSPNPGRLNFIASAPSAAFHAELSGGGPSFNIVGCLGRGSCPRYKFQSWHFSLRSLSYLLCGLLLLLTAVVSQASALVLDGTPVPLQRRDQAAGATLQAITDESFSLNSVDLDVSLHIVTVS